MTVSKHTGFDWKFFWVGKEHLDPQPIPDYFDYDLWLGPAPYKPYNEHRCHDTFRGYWDYDAGGLGDMGQHYLDPVQYLHYILIPCYFLPKWRSPFFCGQDLLSHI